MLQPIIHVGAIVKIKGTPYLGVASEKGQDDTWYVETYELGISVVPAQHLEVTHV